MAFLLTRWRLVQQLLASSTGPSELSSPGLSRRSMELVRASGWMDARIKSAHDSELV